MATELGVAFVSIVPEMSGFARAMSAGMRPAERQASSSGSRSGSAFMDGLKKALPALGIAAAGTALGVAVSAAFTSALDVSKANDKLAAQLGLNEGEAKAAGKVAGSLYAGAYGDSMSEVNDAVGSVMSSIKGMRTASEADVEAMTAKVLDLSAAFEIDTGRAAQVAGQLITSGLAEDGVEAADLLTAALQKVPAAVREDILDATDEYGPFFANLGYSGEEAMGLLVKASEDGMYGIDKTGDALKEFGIRATDLSKSSGDAYATIGLDQLEMSNALLAGGDIASEAFEKIVGGIQGVEDPAARAEAAIGLFGTPLEDLSVNEIPKFLDSLVSTESGLGDVGGAAEAMGDTLNDNAATKIEGFKRTVETAVVNFFADKVLPIFDEVIGGVSAFADAWVSNDGKITSSGFPGFMERVGYWARQAFDYFNTTVLPALQNFVAYIRDTVVPAIQDFIRFLKENKDTIVDVVTVITAIMIPALARLGFAALISSAKQVLAWSLAQAGAVKAGAVYVAQSILMIGRWAWMGVQALFHAGRMAAAWLIAMGPVGWVIAAVVGLAILVIANWDKISAFTKKIWSAIVDWVKGAWSNIKTFVYNALVAVGTWVIDKMNLMKAGWVIIWSAVKDFVVNTWNGIKTWIYDALVWVGTKILSLMDGIKTNWSNAWNWVKTKVSDIWNGIKTVISNAWTGVKSTLQALIDFVKTKPGEAFKAAKDAIGTAWDAIKAKVKDPIRAVVGFVNEGLISPFNGILTKVGLPGIPDLKLPPGFRNGGYTGDGRADEFAGHVHKGEYVFTKEQTAALGKDKLAAMAHSAVRGGKPQAAVGAGVYGGIGSFRGPQFQAIDKANAVTIGGDGASKSRWYLNQAAEMWNGLANVRVLTGGYQPGIPYVHTQETSRLPFAAIPNWAGYYSNSQMYLNPALAGMPAAARRTVAAHEVGHALGLPHAMGSGMRSIMDYGTMYQAGRPTAADAAALRAIYGAPGAGNVASSVGSLDEPIANPLDGTVDWFANKLKEKFPGGGMFIDAAGGLAKEGIGQVVKMVSDIKDGISKIAGNVVNSIKGFFGGGAAVAPTLYDQGGVLPTNGGRPFLVQNKTRKPEIVHTQGQLAERDAHMRSQGAGVVINGNVGWMPDQVAVEIEVRRRRAQTIAGMDGVVFA